MAINDAFASFSVSPAAPATRYAPVTKGAAELPDGPCRALLVGGAGTANLVDLSGQARADVPLQQGYNPIRCVQVSSGGTATDIWALY